MSDRYKDIAYKRNYGFWNEAEQQRLSESKVAIAGVGGDGFQLGIKLAMMGVERFSIADPETFERENSNRVFGATSSNIGKNKAEVFKQMVLDIRPEAKVDIFTSGVTERNVRKFLKGADLLLDESELRYLHIGTLLARTARELGIPDLFVLNIGFSSLVTAFRPDGNGQTFEGMMGFSTTLPLSEVKKREVSFDRVLAYMPSYTDITSLEAVQEGASLPSISPGVDIASAMGSTEAFLHLVSGVSNHRRKPIWAPHVRYMDAYTGKSHLVRMPRFSFYKGAIGMTVRSKILHVNPLASYRATERSSRDQ